MEPIKGYRHYVVNVDGKKKILKTREDIEAEKANKIILFCRGYLFQYVYVQLVIMQIFILVIEDSVKNKKVYRHSVKQKWLKCTKELNRLIKYYQRHAPNEEFTYEYAATFYDKINKDIFRLRDKCADKLNKLGYVDMAGLYSNAIILYNLLMMSEETYGYLLENMRERWGVDLSSLYSDFSPAVICRLCFDFLMEVVGAERYDEIAPHIKHKDMAAVYDKILLGFFDENNTKEAVKNAFECVEDDKEPYRDLEKYLKEEK